MPDLSLILPARCEQFLARTVADALAHIQGDTDIYAILDGAPADPPLQNDPRVHVIYHETSIGQRAAANEAANMSTAKYLMKVDAHCAFDDGFDVKLMADMRDDWTCVPIMRNLHAFDWVCPRGHRRYQGPSGPCKDCGEPTTMDVVWIPKTNPSSTAYCFDATPHFQYHGDYKKRPEGRGDLTETMSLQGSAFMLTRERYHALDICGEDFGSWGSQGIEVACKTWLSGGRCMVNHKTWYAHLFRTQGGDFSFPYSMSGRQQQRAQAHAREMFFFHKKWEPQVRPLYWLVKHFWPVPGWTTADLEKLQRDNGRESGLPSKGMIYYTDNELPETLARPVRERLVEISVTKGLPIVTAALRKRLKFGEKNILFPSLKRGHYAMFKQILGALENSQADVVFFCEHDVLYHLSHFDFTPPDATRYYYNTNCWQVNSETGHAIYYFHRSLSQMCCYRELAIAHYRRKLALVEANGGKYDAKMGFEPGTRGTRHGGVDDSGCGDWRSEVPNIDIRHAGTLSKTKWSQADFRNPANNIDWQEAESVPGWNREDYLFKEKINGNSNSQSTLYPAPAGRG